MAKTAATVQSSTAEPLSLVDELILIPLEEKGGYFHQVPGWQLNGAVVVVGVLAELSFRSRLDLYAKIQAEADALFANGDPEKEDLTPANIDVTHRFLPSRKKRDSLGSAPYELGTHRCLGTGWMEMHLAVNLLMLAHHFTVEVSPAKYARELRFNPFPSMTPSMKLKFRISEQRCELPA